jgi:hypothetical protein
LAKSPNVDKKQLSSLPKNRNMLKKSLAKQNINNPVKPKIAPSSILADIAIKENEAATAQEKKDSPKAQPIIEEQKK